MTILFDDYPAPQVTASLQGGMKRNGNTACGGAGDRHGICRSDYELPYGARLRRRTSAGSMLVTPAGGPPAKSPAPQPTRQPQRRPVGWGHGCAPWSPQARRAAMQVNGISQGRSGTARKAPSAIWSETRVDAVISEPQGRKPAVPSTQLPFGARLRPACRAGLESVRSSAGVVSGRRQHPQPTIFRAARLRARLRLSRLISTAPDTEVAIAFTGTCVRLGNNVGPQPTIRPQHPPAAGRGGGRPPQADPAGRRPTNTPQGPLPAGMPSLCPPGSFRGA